MSKIYNFIIFTVLVIFFEISFILKTAKAAGLQTSINAGMSFFQQTSQSILNPSGYFLLFQAESREHWIRPNFGGQIEYSSKNSMLIDAQIMGGVEVVASNASYIIPFFDIDGLFGWATYSNSSTSASYVGYIFGALVSTGVEIKFSSKPNSSGFRIASQYRFLLGSVGGGVSGSDLNTLQLSVGVTF